MPTYQYRCTDCGNDLEAVQSFSDASLTECPSCGGPLRKVFSSVGLVFKGSGFYKTDSRSGSSASAPAQRKDTAAESAPKEAAKSDSTSSSSSGGSAPASTPSTSSSSSTSSASAA